MQHPLPQRPRARVLAAAGLFAACCFRAAAAGADLDAALIRASELKQPLIVLVAESGQSKADDEARALLTSRAVQAWGDRAIFFELDVGVSRNRAAATRFHIVETPLLLCLTPRGVTLSRDEKPLAASLVLQRIGEAVQQAPELDARLASLESAARKNTGDLAAQFDLANFLVAHYNALEAIPTLATLAHSEANPPDARIRAWTLLIRAHFWIAEPEKARHEAENMMATLGTTAPDARAAGEFVLGSQDAGTKRIARARAEFEAAIAAAPDSPYAKQAAVALANLAKGEPIK